MSTEAETLTSASTFTHPHRVAYSECTVGNHIYYARYLDILERARGEFSRHIGANLQILQDADLIFPALEVNLKYRAPARYDDVLHVNLWVTDVTGVRMRFNYRVVRPSDSKLILEGSTVHVCTSVHEKPKRIPAELLEKLRPYVHQEVVA